VLNYYWRLHTKTLFIIYRRFGYTCIIIYSSGRRLRLLHVGFRTIFVFFSPPPPKLRLLAVPTSVPRAYALLSWRLSARALDPFKPLFRLPDTRPFVMSSPSPCLLDYRLPWYAHAHTHTYLYMYNKYQQIPYTKSSLSRLVWRHNGHNTIRIYLYACAFSTPPDAHSRPDVGVAGCC